MDVLKEAKSKSWHHDIKKIDDKWIEDVVEDFQKESNPDIKDEILRKITENYAIFRTKWAYGFSQFLDGDIEAGKVMHDEVVWISAKKFNKSLVLKPLGKAFNAYLVSSLMNNLKNFRHKKMSHKNHPRVSCQVCGEEVYQIDEAHLRHEVDVDRYQKMLPGYPLVSYDGRVTPPWGGESVKEVTEALLNRNGKYLSIANYVSTTPVGHYTMEDLLDEFPVLAMERIAYCPMTGIRVRQLNASYPESLASGYTEDEFISDFPNFDGLVTCPISGGKKLEITQSHLDKVLKQSDKNERVTIESLKKRYKNITIKPKQVSVMNPYTGKMVAEITHDMLVSAGTNVRDHLSRYASIILGKKYEDKVFCPFTGKKTNSITKKYLDKISKTVHEFYQAVCKYPLRKWQIRSGIDGEWVDNVWSYLAKDKPRYAPAIPMQEFEIRHGRTTKAFVSTNSYFENDSGDSAHISDLLIIDKPHDSSVEMEDSLMVVAQDDMDRKIVSSIKNSHTLEDLFFSASITATVSLSSPFKHGMTKDIRTEIKTKTGHADFDISTPPKIGAKDVTIMVPSRDTIRKRLVRMVGASDLDR